MRTQQKRKRPEHDREVHERPDQHRQDAGRSRHAERPHSRPHRHSHASHSSLDTSCDQDLDDQYHRLQATLSDRVQNVKQREASLHADNQLLQQRLQSTEEREKHLLDREVNVKQKEESLQLERTSMTQLQQDMLQQYNDIISSLSSLEERLYRVHQLMPNPAGTGPQTSNLPPANPSHLAASRRAEPSAPGAAGPKPSAAQGLLGAQSQPAVVEMPDANAQCNDMHRAAGHASQDIPGSDGGLLHAQQATARHAWQQAPVNLQTPAHLAAQSSPSLAANLHADPSAHTANHLSASLPATLPPNLHANLHADSSAKRPATPSAHLLSDLRSNTCAHLSANLSAHSSPNLPTHLSADLPVALQGSPAVSEKHFSQTAVPMPEIRSSQPAAPVLEKQSSQPAVPMPGTLFGQPAVPMLEKHYCQPAETVPAKQSSQPIGSLQGTQSSQPAQHPTSAATTEAACVQAASNIRPLHDHPAQHSPSVATTEAACMQSQSHAPALQGQPAYQSLVHPIARPQQLKPVLLSRQGGTPTDQLASQSSTVHPTAKPQQLEPVLLSRLGGTPQAHHLKPVLLSRQGGTATIQKVVSPSRGQHYDLSRVEARERDSEVASPSSSRGGGRGRGVGRGRGRVRGRSGLHRASFTEPAGDLDEAVQALKATTEGAEPGTDPGVTQCTNANAMLDDDIRPSFMRHVAANHKDPSNAAACTYTMPQRTVGVKHKGANNFKADGSPRPNVRRRTDTDARASARDVLQREVPDLLEMLQQKGLAEQVGLLDESTLANQEGCEAEEKYASMHRILARICEGEGKSNSWQGCSASGIRASGEDNGGKHEYCLLALEHLLERAAAFSDGKQPVRWGWCRQLSSFMFVFEAANRIVVEKPCYGHATYFFDLEEPLPATDQVQRLIAVLSVPGASRRKLLEDCSLDPGPEVSVQERKQLEAAGWKPGSTIRSLLNFSGDRIFHQSADVMTGQKPMLQNALDYKEKIAKVLSEGASGGRITKM